MLYTDTSNLNRGRQLCEDEYQREWCPDSLSVRDADLQVDRWQLLTVGDGSTRASTIDLNEQRYYEPDGRNAQHFSAVAAAVADGHVQIGVHPSPRDVHRTHAISVIVRSEE